MYKAIQEIGGYMPGEIVPDEKAEVWLKMYAVPPVEKVEEKKQEQVVTEAKEEPKPEVKEESPKEDVTLDDYLSRNTSVVINNIEKDDLSQKQLKKLLVLEKGSKNRKVVIKVIEKKLK